MLLSRSDSEVFCAKSCKIIVNNGDTKNIDINNLNTFAITTHRENSMSRTAGTEYFTNINISFPKKLIFEFQALKGDSNVNLKSLSEDINKKITDKIKLAITDLQDNNQKTKSENLSFYQERMREERRGRENKKEEVSTLSRYLSNKFQGTERYWEIPVKAYLIHMKKIVGELKKCDGEKEGGRTNKKRPKKEILGEMRCIYKIQGDRKEYVKHKGKLTTVKDYKELMKAKKAKKPTKLSKKK